MKGSQGMVQLDTQDPPVAEDDHARRALREHLAAAGRRSGEVRRAKRAQRDAARSIDELVDQLVARAPALSDGQRARLETLLAPAAH